MDPSMLNNPDFGKMARCERPLFTNQEMMKNPEIMKNMMNMMSGLGGMGGMGGMGVGRNR